MDNRPSNLDELFRQGLTQHEQAPQATSWQKINTQIGKKRKKTRMLWIGFSSAAAVLVALFIGTSLSKNSTLDAAVVSASQPNTQNQASTNAATEASSDESEEINIEEGSSDNSIDQGISTVTSALRTFKKASKSIAQFSKSVNTIDKPANVIENIVNNVVKTEPEEVSEVSPKVVEPKEPVENTVVTINKPKPVETLADNAEIRSTPTRSYRSISYEAPEREQPKKGLGRLLTQVRKVKNGERVDWDQLGFKPAKLLARAENDFNSGKKTLANEVGELNIENKLN
jgi:hypothetical protein